MRITNALRSALFGGPEQPRLEGAFASSSNFPMEEAAGDRGWPVRGQPEACGSGDGNRPGLYGGNPQKRRCTTEDNRHAKREAALAIGEMKLQAQRLQEILDELDQLADQFREGHGD